MFIVLVVQIKLTCDRFAFPRFLGPGDNEVIHRNGLDLGSSWFVPLLWNTGTALMFWYL